MRRFPSSPQWTKGVLFLGLLLGVIFGPPRKNAGAEVINMAISTVGLYELPTEIAKRKGFYADEGLDVRKVAVRTGLQAAALLAGELDYSTVTGIIMRAAMQGMPLKRLFIHGTGVADLKPLQGMPLEEIRLTPRNITQGLDVLRDMKSLNIIGITDTQSWPAAEFWARYDKGEFKE